MVYRSDSTMLRLVVIKYLALVLTWSAVNGKCRAQQEDDDPFFNYHERVGIPTALQIKEHEDKVYNTPDLENRISGGSVVDQALVPYLAGIQITIRGKSSPSLCGSSLLSPDRLVTAAHCWYDGTSQATSFTMVFGSQYLFYGGVRITASAVVVHPEWNPNTFANDVAMIYLSEKVEYATNVQPIALPTPDLRTETLVGTAVLASGYGKTSDLETSVSVQTTVRQVMLMVISEQECKQYYGVPKVRSTNLCTSGKGGVGICGGDSGGPLVAIRDGQNVLVGISSFVAKNACHAGHPAAFTRVSGYLDFIQEHLMPAMATAPVSTVTGTIPANTIPANTIPASIIPANTLTANTIPASIIPANTIPANTIPASIIPANTIPANTIPASIIPANTIPANTIPASTIPAYNNPTAKRSILPILSFIPDFIPKFLGK